MICHLIHLLFIYKIKFPTSSPSFWPVVTFVSKTFFLRSKNEVFLWFDGKSTRWCCSCCYNGGTKCTKYILRCNRERAHRNFWCPWENTYMCIMPVLVIADIFEYPKICQTNLEPLKFSWGAKENFSDISKSLTSCLDIKDFCYGICHSHKAFFKMCQPFFNAHKHFYKVELCSTNGHGLNAFMLYSS